MKLERVCIGRVRKKYSVCEYEEEIWEHVWDGCAREKVKEVGKRM